MSDMSTNANVEIMRYPHNPHEWWPRGELQQDWELPSNLADEDLLSMLHFPAEDLPTQSNVASGFGSFPQVAASIPISAVATSYSHTIHPFQDVENVSHLAKSRSGCGDLADEANLLFCHGNSNSDSLGKCRYPKSNTTGIRREKVSRSSVAQKHTHVISERQRRKCMNELFQTMQSILPQPISKMDRSTVLTEMIKYIQMLQKKLEQLSQFKSDIIASVKHDKGNLLDVSTDESPTIKSSPVHCESPNYFPGATDAGFHEVPGLNVAVQLYEKDVFVTLTLMKKRLAFSQILLLFQHQSLEVVNAVVSVNEDTIFYSIHAKAPNAFQLGSEKLQNMLRNIAMNH